MPKKNNFLDCAANANTLYEYTRIGGFNDHVMTLVAVADRKLDFHVHEDSDEMFVILDGRMQIEFEDGVVDLSAGDFITVPKGARHRPVCTSLVKCLLVEKDGTLNDGNSGGSYSKSGAKLRSVNITECLQEAAELIRRSFATVAEDFGLTPDNCPTNPAFTTDSALVGRLDRENCHSFGLYLDDVMVGFTALMPAANGAMEITRLAVSPEMRHKGYGRILVDAAMNTSRCIGAKKVVIGIIDANTILKDWYSQYGFIETAKKEYPQLPFVVCEMEMGL